MHFASHSLDCFQEHLSHQRDLDVIATSTRPESLFTPVTTVPYIIDVKSQTHLPRRSENSDQDGLTAVTPFSNAEPSDSAFFSPQFQKFPPQYADNHALWEQAMKQAMITQPQHHQQAHQQSRQRPGISNYGYGMSQSQRSSGYFGSGSSDYNGLANNNARMANRLVTVSARCQNEFYDLEEGTDFAASFKTLPPTIYAEESAVVLSSNMLSEQLRDTSQGHISARYTPPAAGVLREKSLPEATASMRGSQEFVPVFPARLPSMESTLPSLENKPASDSLKSTNDRFSSADSEVQRPARTNADTGTYTCICHGCAQRFKTPANLRKHKRDSHSQSTPKSATTSDMHTQAEPQKCERVNPLTGNPCNIIFSRGYDLTRQEDSIHNPTRQKIACHLCVESKTFSRNDALNRHMRVVHPGSNFPGNLSKRKKIQQEVASIKPVMLSRILEKRSVENRLV